MVLQVDTRDWTLRTTNNRDEMWTLADEEGIRAARAAYPSGWLFLTRDTATRELVRLAAATGGEWQVEELARELDCDVDAVEQGLEDLVSLRVFREEGEMYRPNAESVVANAVGQLRSAADERGASDGFRDLTHPEEVRLLLDALLAMDETEEFTQDDLHDHVGLSRKAVWMHVEQLEELDVLTPSGDGYKINESSSVFAHVRALNAAVLGTALSP